MEITKEDIFAIIEKFEKSSLHKMTFSNDKTTLQLEKAPVPESEKAPLQTKKAEPETGTTSPKNQEKENKSPLPGDNTQNAIPIKAPLAGIFYAAASPTEPPFVKEGDRVKKGDTVGIIEAMKMMNEITAPSDGTIIKIKAQNGKFAAYGEELMMIKG